MAEAKKKEENAVTVADDNKALVAIDDSLFDDAGETREGASQDTMSIPFISILQGTSPQVAEGGTDYIEGARPGMLYNSVTREVINTKNEKVRFVNIAFKESYIEWITRDNGAGFVNEYPVEEGVTGKTQRNDKNEDIIQEGSPVGTPGNQLTYTHTHYCYMIREDGTFQPVVLTMAITQVKPSKDWNYLINNFNIDGRSIKRFATIWEAVTILREKNGNRWHVWAFAKSGSGLLTFELEGGLRIAQSAGLFREGVLSGEHKADLSKAVDANSTAGADYRDDEPANPTRETDEEIPF